MIPQEGIGFWISLLEEVFSQRVTIVNTSDEPQFLLEDGTVLSASMKTIMTIAERTIPNSEEYIRIKEYLGKEEFPPKVMSNRNRANKETERFFKTLDPYKKNEDDLPRSING